MVTVTLTVAKGKVWPNDYGDDNSGMDDITGTSERDIILTGLGDDTVKAGGGDDLVFGGHDEDIISGNAGSDFLVGEDDDDTLNGNENADFLFGHDGNDELNGGTHDDFLFGGLMDDTLNGGRGADRLYGDQGSDTLEGDQGNDTLNGGADNDTLNGGADMDLLTGGPGNDVFVFAKVTDSTRANPDEILDFTTGNNLIDLRPIDAKDNTAADDAFNAAIVKGAGAPGAVAQAQLYYDTVGQDLYGNVGTDTVADFRIDVGVADVNAGDFFL